MFTLLLLEIVVVVVVVVFQVNVWIQLNSQNNMNMQGLLIILSITFMTLFDQQFVTAYNGIKLIKEVGKNICPYTTYCHTNASRNLNTTVDDFIPSCLPCSCDEDCWDYRTCCPDKETDSRSTTLPCKLSRVKRPTVSYTGTVEDVLIQRIGANYRVVDHCPSSVNNETVREKCEANEGDRLQDYVWVSESANGMIYQNIHCAECHGVSQVWHWDIRTSCFEILDTFVNIEDTLLGTDCDITNTAPDDKASLVSEYRCYDFDLEDGLSSDCNVSTDLRNDFLTACNQSTWPYIVAMSMQASGKYYKNVFCYACQFGIDAVITSIPYKHPTLGNRVPSISFSAVLNYREQPRSIGIDGHRSCLSNQIFDNYMVSIFLTSIKPFHGYVVLFLFIPFLYSHRRRLLLLHHLHHHHHHHHNHQHLQHHHLLPLLFLLLLPYCFAYIVNVRYHKGKICLSFPLAHVGYFFLHTIALSR